MIKRDKNSIKTNIQHQTHGLHVLGKFELSKTKSLAILPFLKNSKEH